MKNLTSNTFIKKVFTVITILFVALALSSCEKQEVNNGPSAYNSPTDVIIESFAIDSSDWCCKDNHHEVILPSTFYNKDNECHYLKIFLKVKEGNNQSLVWKELPYKNNTFTIKEYKIIAKKYSEICEAKYYFRIELKIKKDNSCK